MLGDCTVASLWSLLSVCAIEISFLMVLCWVLNVRPLYCTVFFFSICMHSPSAKWMLMGEIAPLFIEFQLLNFSGKHLLQGLPIAATQVVPQCEGGEKPPLCYLQTSCWAFSPLGWKGTTCTCSADAASWLLQMGWTGSDLGAHVWKVMDSHAQSLCRMLCHLMNNQPVTHDKYCCKWARTLVFFLISFLFIIRQAETFTLISHLSIFLFLYPQVPAFIISHNPVHTNTINK